MKQDKYQTASHRKKQTSHGGTHTRLYKVWGSMRTRCYNENADNYYLYGGRGIKICDEWENFENFRDWAMSHGYDPYAPYGECTLDRIDPNGDYCPENCRFVSSLVQANNKNTTSFIEYNGQKMALMDFARMINMDPETVRHRIKMRFMTPDEIATTPIDDYQKKITVDGITDTLTNFCKKYNIDRELVRDRIFRSGWDPKVALTTPLCNSSPKYDVHEYMGTVGNYRDFDNAIGFKEGTISNRVRKQGMTLGEAISAPLRKKGSTTNAVFFVDPKTRKPINQFSNLIDTPQYQEDLKTFGELIMNKSDSKT